MTAMRSSRVMSTPTGMKHPNSVAAALAVVTLLASCGRSTTAPSTERERLTLGGIAGPGSPSAEEDPTVRAVRLAASEYNRSRDSTYEVSVKGTGGKGSDPAAAAKELAGQNRLIGSVVAPSSTEATAAGPAFLADSIPLLITSNSSESLPGEGWKNFRRLVATDRAEGRAVARAAARKATGFGFIFHDNTPSGRAFADGAKEFLDSAKRPTPRGIERISAKTSLPDLAGPIAQDANAVVLFGGDGTLAIRLGAALKSLKFKGAMGVSAGALGAKGGTVPDGILAGSSGAEPGDSRLASFRSRYRNSFGAAPPALAAEAYEGAWMLLEAIEEVEPRPRAITDFFALNRTFRGDSKVYNYDDRGELRDPAVWIYEGRSGNWAPAGRQLAR